MVEGGVDAFSAQHSHKQKFSTTSVIHRAK
jgi:hypothetical protein